MFCRISEQTAIISLHTIKMTYWAFPQSAYRWMNLHCKWATIQYIIHLECQHKITITYFPDLTLYTNLSWYKNVYFLVASACIHMFICNFASSYSKQHSKPAHVVSIRQSVSACTKWNLYPLQNKSSCVTGIDFLKIEQEISDCDECISWMFVQQGFVVEDWPNQRNWWSER